MNAVDRGQSSSSAVASPVKQKKQESSPKRKNRVDLQGISPKKVKSETTTPIALFEKENDFIAPPFYKE